LRSKVSLRDSPRKVRVTSLPPSTPKIWIVDPGGPSTSWASSTVSQPSSDSRSDWEKVRLQVVLRLFTAGDTAQWSSTERR
jgi:hypothetical protein